MSDALTIFLAGGGTGGHLYPGISVAQALRRLIPAIELVFLCTQRPIDTAILTPTGFEFITQPIVPLARSISGLIRFSRGWRETTEQVKELIRARRPALVLGLGGYAAGVAVRMAASGKRLTAILNPDVIPGKANQFLMRRVDAVCCQFEQTRDHVSPSRQHKLHFTGCPVRESIGALPERSSAAVRLGLEPMLKTLVVTGASQGAQTVNDAVLGALANMKLQGWQMLHLAGKEHAAAVQTSYRGLSITSRVIDFTPSMEDVWAVADLAVSRSGASSCAELTACGIPSILMPYPFHKDMHQRANARVLEGAGAALILEDEKNAASNSSRLQPMLESLVLDGSARSTMARAAKSLGKPEAAGAVAKLIMEMLRVDR